MARDNLIYAFALVSDHLRGSRSTIKSRQKELEIKRHLLERDIRIVELEIELFDAKTAASLSERVG